MEFNEKNCMMNEKITPYFDRDEIITFKIHPSTTLKIEILTLNTADLRFIACFTSERIY
jgi:hypothetical protein